MNIVEKCRFTAVFLGDGRPELGSGSVLERNGAGRVPFRLQERRDCPQGWDAPRTLWATDDGTPWQAVNVLQGYEVSCDPFNRVTKPEWYPPCYDNLSRVLCVRDEAEIQPPGPLPIVSRLKNVGTVYLINFSCHVFAFPV